MPSFLQSSSPPLFPHRHENTNTERRLRESEERLCEAIEGLQRRQRRATPGASHSHPPDEWCFAHAIGNLCQSFLLSYGDRVGTGILLHAFKLAKGHSYSSLLDLKVAPLESFYHSRCPARLMCSSLDGLSSVVLLQLIEHSRGIGYRECDYFIMCEFPDSLDSNLSQKKI